MFDSMLSMMFPWTLAQENHVLEGLIKTSCKLNGTPVIPSTTTGEIVLNDISIQQFVVVGEKDEFKFTDVIDGMKQKVINGIMNRSTGDVIFYWAEKLEQKAYARFCYEYKQPYAPPKRENAMNFSKFKIHAKPNCKLCKGSGEVTGHTYFHACNCIRHPKANGDCTMCKGAGFYDEGGMYGPAYSVCECML